jgi:hypothetical protein
MTIEKPPGMNLQVPCTLYPGHEKRGTPDCDPTPEPASSGGPCLNGITVLENDDRLIVEGASWRPQTVVTLSGYGFQYNRFSRYDGPDGMAQYLMAAERNKASTDAGVAWIHADATVISNTARLSPARTVVSIGQLVYLRSATPGEGGFYRILRSHPARGGDNCRLVRVTRDDPSTGE